VLFAFKAGMGGGENENFLSLVLKNGSSFKIKIMNRRKHFIELFAITVLMMHDPIMLFAQTQLGGDIDGANGGDFSGYAISTPDTFTVGIGGYGNDDNGTESGHVRVYRLNGITWVQKGNDINGEAAGDHCGMSIDMPDSNTIAIGAPENSGNGLHSGQVRVFTWNGSAWVQKGNDIDGEAPSDRFGWSVSMPDSDHLAVGAIFNSGNGPQAGHVRVYHWNGSAWIQKGADLDGEAALDEFGYSVSMPDSEWVGVGAEHNDGNGSSAGHVRIFKWNGNAWVQMGADLDGEAAFDWFGSSVSMADSNTIGVGAFGNDGNGNNAGRVKVFTWNGASWVQKGPDINGEAADDLFGVSVKMSHSNNIVVGAPGNDGNGTDAGHMRLYRYYGNDWDKIGVDAEGEAAYDRLGISVSSSDPYMAAAGAPHNAGNGFDAGHVRVYNNLHIGLQEHANEFSANVYPNPASDEITIDLGSMYHHIEVSVFNSMGQKLQSQNFSNTQTVNFELCLEQGIYVVEVAADGKRSNYKFVVK